MAVNTLTLSHTGGRQTGSYYTRSIGSDKLHTVTDTAIALQGWVLLHLCIHPLDQQQLPCIVRVPVLGGQGDPSKVILINNLYNKVPL